MTFEERINEIKEMKKRLDDKKQELKKAKENQLSVMCENLIDKIEELAPKIIYFYDNEMEARRYIIHYIESCLQFYEDEILTT